MALEAIRVVCNYDYRFAAGAVMWAFRQRWHIFKMRWPVYKRLHELEKDYWHLWDQWAELDLQHRSLYIKYQDLNDEVRYWETRHAKIMNYIEKKMELDETWGK